MKIEWNQITKLSQIVAIVVFVAVFGVGFFVGTKYESKSILGEPAVSAKFVCPDKSVIKADFFLHFVRAEIPGLGKLHLARTVSASGARYGNNDDSIVLWNKGDTVFIQKDGQTILDNCVTETPNK
jgi:hypothetical protein